jgi:peptide methionine sulfoxide reductase msrA/msrB
LLLSVVLLIALAMTAPAMAKSSEASAPSRVGEATDSIVLGMGCFWGAEKRMAALPGVLDVESGYANGDIEGSYRAIIAHESALRRGRASGRNHAEVVRVVFDPARVSLEEVLIHFWESHDPTQGDCQGNDVGSNYRSAIYLHSDGQRAVAIKTRDAYQAALTQHGRGTITTEIEPLEAYFRAEEDHQDYLKKNPRGYCGLGGTGVPYPRGPEAGLTESPALAELDAGALDPERQLVVFEAVDCAFCRQFKAEVLDHWQGDVQVARTLSTKPPEGWRLERALFATPTIVLFEKGREVSRFTGYNGERQRFWKWLGYQLLTPEQRAIAFESGTEPAFTGSHLDEKRPGAFVDPITGAVLFRSDTKFDSGTGWPSFFNPVEGAITEHVDESHGMRRIEVRSASSGIHLGHVFEDGPPPTHRRYCINGNVLKFVPDE